MRLNFMLMIAAIILSSCSQPAIKSEQTKVKDDVDLTTKINQLAAKGDANAQYELGLEYGLQSTQTNNKQDLINAKYWYKKAALQNHAKAQYMLGILYFAGQAISKQDFAKAKYWWEKSAAQDYAKAQEMLGVLYTVAHPGVNKQDYVKANELFKKSCDLGLQRGCDQYKRYASAVGNTNLEPEKQLASQGDAKAQTSLGNAYFKGDSIKQDYTKAKYWWEKAAAQGYAKAQSNLGALYGNGISVKKDYAKAKYWWEKAAAQGFVESQYSLGYMYAQGSIGKRDYVKAKQWFGKACDLGSIIGCDEYEKLNKQGY